MRGDVNLTPDQATDLCVFWGFDADESNYFLDLVMQERAGSPSLKALLADRIARMRRDKQQVASQVRMPRLEHTEEQGIYYSSWIYGAVHVLASIPQCAQTAKIAKRLQLPAETVSAAVKVLCNMGLMTEAKTGLQVTKKSIHLPADAPMAAVSHLNWRLKAMQPPLKAGESLHYTGVLALSEDLQPRLKAMLMGMIKDVHGLVAVSPEEKLVCLNLDFFEP